MDVNKNRMEVVLFYLKTRKMLSWVCVISCTSFIFSFFALAVSDFSLGLTFLPFSVPAISIASFIILLISTVVLDGDKSNYESTINRIALIEKLDAYNKSVDAVNNLKSYNALSEAQKVGISEPVVTALQKDNITNYINYVVIAIEKYDYPYLCYILSRAKLDYTRIVTLSNGSERTLFDAITSWRFMFSNRDIAAAFVKGLSIEAINSFIVPQIDLSCPSNKDGLLHFAARQDRNYLLLELLKLPGLNLALKNLEGSIFLHDIRFDLSNVIRILRNNTTTDTRLSLVNTKNNSGITPLCSAIAANKYKLANTFMDWGANPNLYNRPHTLLSKMFDSKDKFDFELDDYSKDSYSVESDEKFFEERLAIRLVRKIDVNKLNQDIIICARPTSLTSNYCLLMRSMELGMYNVAEALINKDGFNLSGKPLLHLAVEILTVENDFEGRNKILSIIRRLIDKRLDLYLVCKGKTFIHVLIERCARLSSSSFRREVNDDIKNECIKLLNELLKSRVVTTDHKVGGCETSIGECLTANGFTVKSIARERSGLDAPVNTQPVRRTKWLRCSGKHSTCP